MTIYFKDGASIKTSMIYLSDGNITFKHKSFGKGYIYSHMPLFTIKKIKTKFGVLKCASK